MSTTDDMNRINRKLELEYIRRLEALHAHDGREDAESIHIAADDLVINFLEEVGYVRLATTYNRVESEVGGFWYA